MAKRVLCEIKTCGFTGIEYPSPYEGNCFYSEDSKSLQDFKREALARHPELKGKLKIVTVNSMEKAKTKLVEARNHNVSYIEWRRATNDGQYFSMPS